MHTQSATHFLQHLLGLVHVEVTSWGESEDEWLEHPIWHIPLECITANNLHCVLSVTQYAATVTSIITQYCVRIPALHNAQVKQSKQSVPTTSTWMRKGDYHLSKLPC